MSQVTGWEYCAIKSDAGVKYFSASGDHNLSKFEGEKKDVHQSIAQLGTEGWELVSFSSLPESTVMVYYFKRPT